MGAEDPDTLGKDRHARRFVAPCSLSPLPLTAGALIRRDDCVPCKPSRPFWSDGILRLCAGLLPVGTESWEVAVDGKPLAHELTVELQRAPPPPVLKDGN